MAKKSSQHLLNELRSAFNLMDTNKDGTISREELKLIVKQVGIHINEKELDDMLKNVDKNGDGKIEFDEFVNEMSKKSHQLHSKEDLVQTFKYFDKDNSGSIDENELFEAMKQFRPSLTRDEVKKIISKIDHDHSGKINLDEFLQMMS